MNNVAKIGVLFVAVAVVVGVSLTAHAENDDDKNPLIGAWELSSEWGDHTVIVFPDLSGIIKDMERDWVSELFDVKCEGENVSLAFEHGQYPGNDIEFEGTVEDDEIVGEFSADGKFTDVEGVPFSVDPSSDVAKKSLLVGSWKLTSDWGGGEWEYYLVVFPDSTGSLKEMEGDYTSEVIEVNATAEDTAFTFMYGGEGDEIVFEGSITGDEIEGRFSIAGKSAPVEGARN